MKVTTVNDTEKVMKIRKQLRENNMYCPTKKEHIPENLCMCKEFIEQDVGECSCGLYIKLDK